MRLKLDLVRFGKKKVIKVTIVSQALSVGFITVKY